MLKKDLRLLQFRGVAGVIGVRGAEVIGRGVGRLGVIGVRGMVLLLAL